LRTVGYDSFSLPVIADSIYIPEGIHALKDMDW